MTTIYDACDQGNCVGHGHSHGHGHGHGHVLDEAKPLPSSKGRDITILYGSQTGTAQDVAEGLGRDAERYAIDAHVCAMDDIPRDLLPSLKLLVIVCSTTGDGTTPDNMKMNYRALLRKSLSPTYLAGVRFAIFGLGDSSYAKYNASARRLWVRMQQLGATPLLTNPGLGDDQEQLGYDAALEPWADALWTRLLAPDVLPLPPGVKPQRDGLMPPRFRVEEIGQPPIDNHAMQVDDAGVDDSGVYSSKHPYLAEISSISKVTPAEHFQDVRLVEIDLGNSGMTHPPGAVLSVLPRNLEPDAKDFCELLGLDPAQWVRLVRSQEHTRRCSSEIVVSLICASCVGTRDQFILHVVFHRCHRRKSGASQCQHAATCMGAHRYSSSSVVTLTFRDGLADRFLSRRHCSLWKTSTPSALRTLLRRKGCGMV